MTLETEILLALHHQSVGIAKPPAKSRIRLCDFHCVIELRHDPPLYVIYVYHYYIQYRFLYY